MKKSMIIVLACVFVLGVAVSSYAALNAPIPVSPKVAYGQTKSHASRTPTFSWTWVDGAAWYRIWVAKSSDPNTAVIDQWVEGNATSWTPSTDRVLDAGENYSWWIRSWNLTEGYGPWSSQADFVIGPITYLTIPASAFQPHESTYTFAYEATCIKNLDGNSEWYIAPLLLPHGSNIKRITFYYRNQGTATTASKCYLYKVDNDINSYTSLLSLTGVTTIGDHSKASAWGIDIPINYKDSHYVIEWDLPGTQNWGHDVRIEYQTGDYK